MKKMFLVLLLILLISSCSMNTTLDYENKEVIEQNSSIVSISDDTIEYIVWSKENNFINIYWNVVNNNLKEISSNIAGKVTYLSCDVWDQVNNNTVIAKISPDTASLSYKNNLIQLNSLKQQLTNLNDIRKTTISNYESQEKQINLQLEELNNQINKVNSTIWNNNNEWLKNQQKIINDSIELLKQNQKSSLKSIDDSIINLKITSYNTFQTTIKRIDEVFWITIKNKNLNNEFEDYLWAKDTTTTNKISSELKIEINDFESYYDFLGISNNELSIKMNNFSELLKNVSKVIDNSVSSVWTFDQTTITSLYNEFIWYSDWIIQLKTNLDNLINSKESTKLSFEAKIKELESSITQLDTQNTSLNTNINTINNNKKTLEEQLLSLSDSKKSSLKQIDNQVLSIEQAIWQINVSLSSETIYAWINWTVKMKKAQINNNINIWTSLCTILPETNSLKLEIYSPQKLDIWQKFNYYKDNKLIWEWEISSEYPSINSTTQNYTYQGNISFTNLKEWDYLDIKVLSQSSADEVWIPINYLQPKLNWYYVRIKKWEEINLVKVEVWNMNNWEILINSWIDVWDILVQ